MKTITKAEASKKVAEYQGGQVFTVTFVKRSTGETRVMNCRKGVVKHSKGGELKYDPAKKGLVSVFDMQKGGYRCISLEDIRKISMSGEVYDVE